MNEMTPLKSQVLGLSLSLATAIGCIFYEKIVHNFSYLTFLILVTIEFIILGVIAYFFFDNDLASDLKKFTSDIKYPIWTLIYICTGVTSLLWYTLTKDQGVMVSSTYEMKYIVIMALIYIVFGENKFTWNTAIGVSLAIGSVYFISKK